MHEELAAVEALEQPAGNGRDEADYALDQVQEALQAADELVRPPPTSRQAAVRQEASPQLTKLFVTAVENGYLIRPAYSQGERIANTDDRSWVVTSREELARMVTWLVAERGPPATRDMLGGARAMPQPEQHYVPPQVLEEAGV
jgi:hypothetical protein